MTRPLRAGTGSWRFPIQEAPAGPARSGAPATEGRKLARLPPGLPSKGMNMKEYQRPPTFIAGSAWSRGYLKPLELLRIAAWKTGQGLGSLTINTKDDIEGRTRAAIDCIRPWRGKRIVAHDDLSMWHQWYETARSAIGEKAAGLGLLALHGVGYPMASAILDILDPEVWPVIDRWAIQTVFGRQPNGNPWPTSQWDFAAAYAVYARHLATIGAACWGSAHSIHKLDQEAMNVSKSGSELPPSWVHAVLPARGTCPWQTHSKVAWT